MTNINRFIPDIQTLWDYNCLNHERRVPENVDVVVALGCKDIGVARQAAEIQLAQPDSILVTTGKYGKYTQGLFAATEAEVFADVALDMGVPREQIIVEPNARNTGENIRFTHDMVCYVGKTAVSSVILVHKPFLERRALATFEAQWPGAAAVKAATMSESLDFMHYCNEKQVPPHDVARQVVGATARVMEYSRYGYQTEQPVSDEVYVSYERLVSAGFDESARLPRAA